MRTIIQIQRDDGVGYTEAKRRYCAQFQSAAIDGDVHVGDSYRRSDGATVTIVAVNPGEVVWEFRYRGEISRNSASHDDFARLEAKSLKWGAVFTPAVAPSNSNEVTLTDVGGCA